MNNMLNRIVYPSKAPTPIQYQQLWGNKLRDFNKASPSRKSEFLFSLCMHKRKLVKLFSYLIQGNSGYDVKGHVLDDSQTVEMTITH